MYRVIGNLKTRAVRVLWALEEMGLPYELITKSPRTDEVRALNPSGKVPVLLDGDAVLTDSTAIMTYLADKHQMLTHPAGTLERARQDALTNRILDEFDAVLWTAARHSFILPEDMRLPAIKDSLKWEFARNAALLAAEVKGPFLMGEALLVPDIILANCLNWAVNVKFPVEQKVLLEFRDRVYDRPALRRIMDA